MKEIRSVGNFLDHEYKDFAFDVIENRAIPSVIDGFKPTARKIVYVSNKIWKTGSEKSMKLFQLSGRVAAEAFYHHGDLSLNSTETGMCQTFKNNLCLFDGDGQFGSLRVPEAGAPRYIGCKLNSNFRKLYKDFELLEPKFEEGCEIEPSFFLPIIPMVIINGTSGIAVGYASNILNRNPKDVIQACIDVLNGDPIKELKPHLNEFSGTYTRDLTNPNKWISRGTYSIISSTDVRVTELPPSWTFEKYESYLDSLVEKKKIKDYDNNSSDKIDYTLKFTRADLSDLISSGDLDKLLKIEDSETENLTTIDENSKLKIFSRVEDLVEYFVNYRLGWYNKRKEYWIKKWTYDLDVLKNKALFISNIIKGDLVVANTPKTAIETYLESHNFLKVDDKYDYLINLPIHSLTKEKYEQLKDQLKEKKKMIDDLASKTDKDLYLSDLEELKSIY